MLWGIGFSSYPDAHLRGPLFNADYQMLQLFSYPLQQHHQLIFGKQFVEQFFVHLFIDI